MPTCLRCGNACSPDNARFCVQCGYPLRQTCPYPGCDHADVPLGDRESPRSQCPACRRFYKYCTNCRRLYMLTQDECDTARCVHNPPELREPIIPFSNARADEGCSSGAEIMQPWQRGVNSQMEGTLATGGPVYGLAYRYSYLCFLGEETFSMFPTNRWMNVNLTKVTPTTVHLDDKVLRLGQFNSTHVLHLAHGMAYALMESGVKRIDLASRAPQTLHGRFLFQTVTPTRWVGLSANSRGALLVEECSASDDFQPLGSVLVDGVRLEDVADVVTIGESVYIAARGRVYTLRDGKASPLWSGPHDEYSIRSLLVYGENLLVFCRASDGTRLQRVSSAGENVGQPIDIGSRVLYPYPIQLGQSIYFFDNSAGRHRILGCSIEYPAHRPHEMAFVGDADVIFALGARHGDEAWLLYALDDGRDVTFQATAAKPHLQGAWTVGQRMGNDRRISMAVADGRFALAATSTIEQKIRLFDLSEARGDTL